MLGVIPGIPIRPGSVQPFMFQEKTGYINWQLIGKADIESLQREGDLSLIQTYVQGLVYSQLRKEDVKRLGNPTFVQLFKLSQLSIEYLLYIQDILETSGRNEDLEYIQLQKQCLELEAVAKEQRDKIVKLKSKIRAKKKKMESCDTAIKDATTNRKKPVFQCNICHNKYYESKKALEGHYKRRHPVIRADSDDQQNSPRFNKNDHSEISRPKEIPEVIPVAPPQTGPSAEDINNIIKGEIQRELQKQTQSMTNMLNAFRDKYDNMNQQNVPRDESMQRELQDKLEKLTIKMNELQNKKNNPIYESEIVPDPSASTKKVIPKIEAKKEQELTIHSFENIDAAGSKIESNKIVEEEKLIKPDLGSRQQKYNNMFQTCEGVDFQSTPSGINANAATSIILEPEYKPPKQDVGVQIATKVEDKNYMNDSNYEEPADPYVKGTIRNAEVGKVS